MELDSDDEYAAYEMDESGAVFNSVSDPAPPRGAAAAPRQVHVHRSGSIDITSMPPRPPLVAPPNPAPAASSPSSATPAAPAAPVPNDTGNFDAYVAQLGAKIRRQAGDLQRLQTALDEATRYSQLCERRISELHPDHPIPVTEACLGVPNPANGVVGGGRVVARGGGTGAVAKLRREKLELVEAHTSLERQLRSTKGKLTDVSRNLKETRAQAQAKDRELSYQSKKIAKLEARVQELEGGDRSAASSSTAVVLPPSANTGPDAAAALRAEVTSLRASLQNEARSNEEQRVYINVLESAVQAKASEMGLESGQADLLTQLARLQGELSARSREQEASQAAVKALEAEMDDLRAREAQAHAQGQDQEAKIRTLSERLAQFGRGEDELLASVRKLEAEKTALLDYVQDNVARTAELTQTVQKLESDKIEAERRAQDDLAALRRELGSATQNTELLRLQTQERAGEAEAVGKEATELRERLRAAQGEIGGLEEAARDAAAERSELEGVQNELLETIREKTGELERTSAELLALRAERLEVGGEAETLRAKCAHLELRMDAQKDLLRQDHAAAVNSLEEELAAACTSAEAAQGQLQEVSTRCEQAERDLRARRDEVGALERANGQLVRERDSQTAHLVELSQAQEQAERALGDVTDRLDAADAELSVLRDIKAACDRLAQDAAHQHRQLEAEQDDDDSRAAASGKKNADAAGMGSGGMDSALAAWCRHDSVTQQLRQAGMGAVARALTRVGRAYQSQHEHLQQAVREKEVVTRTLNDEIYALRSQQDTLKDLQVRMCFLRRCGCGCALDCCCYCLPIYTHRLCWNLFLNHLPTDPPHSAVPARRMRRTASGCPICRPTCRTSAPSSARLAES